MDHLNSETNGDNKEALQKSSDQKWLRNILIIGVIYCLDGIVFGFFAGWSKSHTMVIIWRLAAWLTSAVIFTCHILYEHYRFNHSSHKTALYVSSAAGIGAFGLAVAANIHAQFVSSANTLLLALSLVIWPILTIIPAFIVAFVLASFLQHFIKKIDNRFNQ